MVIQNTKRWLLKAWLLVAPVAVLVAPGYGDGTTAPSTSKPNPVFALNNISKGSNVQRASFAPRSLTSRYAPFQKNSEIHLLQVTGKDVLGGVLARGVTLSENTLRGNFQDNVGKSFPVGSGGMMRGVPTVRVEYYQDNGPLNRSRWRAVSGTVVIEAYRRNSPTTEIVTFRLVNARFAPFFSATGKFDLSLKATTSGQPNPK